MILISHKHKVLRVINVVVNNAAIALRQIYDIKASKADVLSV